MDIAAEQRRRSFGIWLHTGRRPDVLGYERKFNPWHDPENGKFTFAGEGRYFAPGKGGLPGGRRQDAPPLTFREDPSIPPFNSDEEIDAWAAEVLAIHGKKLGAKAAIESRSELHKKALASRPRNPLRKAGDFVHGFGQGVSDVGKAAAAGLYSLVTTHPATTVRNLEFGLARMIDDAIEAEDTPAHIQISRAAHSIANASAHDIGYAIGSLGGNVGLAVVPGAVVTKVSTAARIGTAGKIAAASESASAQFGTAVSTNYRTTFFDAHPNLKDRVVVHHAVEQQIMRRFPDVVTKSEIHSLENLRGIPRDLNSKVHLSEIRKEWNRFYKNYEARGINPSKDEILKKATEIDSKYGSRFNPKR